MRFCPIHPDRQLSKNLYCMDCGKIKEVFLEPLDIPCADERPMRKVLCQLIAGHKGSCRAVIYWEKEE